MVLLGWMVALNAQADPDVVSQPRRLYGLGSLDVAAVSADRRHLATAGDSAAYLWDFESGTVRYRLPDHRVTVSALAFSPDSTRLVTGARFGSIAVWSTETGARLSLFGAHAGDVSSLAFASDGKRFVSASPDNTAAVWSLETGELLQRFGVKGRPLKAAAFTPDGTRIVTIDTSPADNVRVWDIASGMSDRVLEGHAWGALSMAFLSDGTLATGGQDQKVRLWDLATGSAIRTLDAARGGVTHLAVLPGMDFLVAGSQDQWVHVYDWRTGDAPHRWQTEPLGSLVWIPGTETLLTATTDLLLRVVDLASGLTQRALEGHTLSVAAGAPSAAAAVRRYADATPRRGWIHASAAAALRNSSTNTARGLSSVRSSR